MGEGGGGRGEWGRRLEGELEGEGGGGGRLEGEWGREVRGRG